MIVTEDQIKHMVERFLAWRLPETFRPDGGISFKADYNEHTPFPAKHEPMGTNLFDYEQAVAMVRHMLADMPSGVIDEIAAERKRQIEVEGWTPEHDDEHSDGALALAAIAYAYASTLPSSARRSVTGTCSHVNIGLLRDLWPTGWKWKPKGRRHDLVRAAALIVAEIERLDRASAEGANQDGVSHETGE